MLGRVGFWSAGQDCKTDGRSLTTRGGRLRGHVAASWMAHSSFCSSRGAPTKRGDRNLVGEDADDGGAAFDLAVQPLDRVGRAQFGPMGYREAHIGQHAGFALVHQGGELGECWPELVRSPAVQFLSRPDSCRSSRAGWFQAASGWVVSVSLGGKPSIKAWSGVRPFMRPWCGRSALYRTR